MQPLRDETTGVWGRTHRALTLGLLLVVSLTAFEALAVATVLPATAADLSAGNVDWYGWVFSAFMLANLVGIPAAGFLSDRGGPVWPFAAGCLLFAGGLLFSGLAPSMPLLVAGRIAQGLGAGAISSVAYVAIARVYDSRDQPRMLALVASAWVVPGLIGPAIAAAMASQLGWRSVFLLLVPLTAVGAVLATNGLSELGAARPAARAANRARRQLASALQLAAGTGLALAAGSIADRALACVALVVGVLVGLPALQRLVPAGTLSAEPGAPAALAAKTLVTFAFFGAEAFLPLALTAERGLSMTVAGIVLTTGTMAWTTGAWIQERFAARIDHASMVRGGLAMVILAIAGAAVALVAPWPAAVALASWATAGLGIGICYSAATLVVFERTATGDEGEAASALQLANVLGVALGTGVAGAMVTGSIARGSSQLSGIAWADVIMLIAAGIGLLAAARISRPDPGIAFPSTGETRATAVRVRELSR
jgi:MFS family permease